jgi:hypothetical protein
LQKISSIAGAVQLGADATAVATAAIPGVDEVVTPIAVIVSKVAGGVTMLSDCAGALYANNDGSSCLLDASIYEATAGFASEDAGKSAISVLSDIYAWILEHLDAASGSLAPPARICR